MKIIKQICRFMFSMFNIPNLFTAGNMLCGILAILLSVSGRIDLAPFTIFLGAVLDFFDGFLARLLKKQGELGKQLDSLADMVTFGIAPGILMLVVLTHAIYKSDLEHITFISASTAENFHKEVFYSFRSWIDYWGTAEFSWLPFCALFIPFMSMFRLAKFNIDTRQTVSFIGVPTPANTIFFTAFPLILAQSYHTSGIGSNMANFIFQPAVLIAIIVIMSLLLVSEIPLFALKFKQYNWKGNEIRYTFLILCAILIPTLLAWSIPIIVLLYIVLSVIENISFKNKQHEIQS